MTYEYCSKLKFTIFYYCVEAKGLVIINTQSNYIFLIIDEVVDRNNSSKPTNKNVLLTTKDKKLLAPNSRDIANKKLLVFRGQKKCKQKITSNRR